MFVGNRMEFNWVTYQKFATPDGCHSTKEVSSTTLTRFEPHVYQCRRTAFALRFCTLFFNITIQRSLLALSLIFVSGYRTFAGIAVLISFQAENTQSGNGLINNVTLPMFILSGIFFSYHNFPNWLIPYVEVLPLTILTNSLESTL
jgi:ABC-type polysaccharide/polyol phosphate export permease